MGAIKISNFQVFTLFFTSILSTVVVVYPMTEAGKAGWVSVALSTLPLLCLVALIHLLNSQEPDKTILDLLNPYPWLKYVVCIAYTFYAVILLSLTIADFAMLINTSMLPDTPLVVTATAMMAVSVLGAKAGIEAIARSSEWVFPILILVIIIATLVGFPDIDFSNLTPILESGMGPIIKSSLIVFDFAGFIFLALFLNHHVNKPSNVSKTLLILILTFNLATMIQSMLIVGVFGETLLPQFQFVTNNLARYLEIDIFRGFDAPLTAMWFTSIIIKISLILWFVDEKTSTTFKLKGKGHIITPFALISLAWSFRMFPSIIEFNNFIRVFPYYAITMQFILPVLLTGFYFFFIRPRGKKNNPGSGFRGKKGE